MGKIILLCLYSLSSVASMIQLTRGEYPRVTVHVWQGDVVALIAALCAAYTIATM